MNDLDRIAAALADVGYRVHLEASGRSWVCSLECSVSILPGNLPRPRGSATDCVGAVRAAINSYGTGFDHYGPADRQQIEKAKAALESAWQQAHH